MTDEKHRFKKSLKEIIVTILLIKSYLIKKTVLANKILI